MVTKSCDGEIQVVLSLQEIIMCFLFPVLRNEDQVGISVVELMSKVCWKNRFNSYF